MWIIVFLWLTVVVELLIHSVYIIAWFIVSSLQLRCTRKICQRTVKNLVFILICLSQHGRTVVFSLYRTIFLPESAVFIHQLSCYFCQIWYRCVCSCCHCYYTWIYYLIPVTCQDILVALILLSFYCCMCLCSMVL